MLLDPEGVLAMLREQRKSDLALICVVAMAACTPEELDAGVNPWLRAAERLEEATRRLRENYDRKRMPRKPRGTGRPSDVLAFIQAVEEAREPRVRPAAGTEDLVQRVPSITEKLVPVLRQVAKKLDELEGEG